MLIKLKKNTLWSIFWEAPQQVSKEGVGKSEFWAARAMVTNRWNVNKDERPDIKVFTTDINLEKFQLTRIPAFEFNAFLTLSWRRPLSYTNKSIDLQSK